MRFLPDRFTLYRGATVLLASMLPAQGRGIVAFEWISSVAIALLFFLHGARMSRDALIAGIVHWRLHLTIFTATFLLFHLLGVALKPLLTPFITPELYLGILFLCTLPATVQSSIAFTSIARGNVAAAVCSASASSLLGIFLTPLLVSVVVIKLGKTPIAFDAVGKIMLQLLLPFVLGQCIHRLIGAWTHRHKPILKFVDQGSILLVVYSAFSAAMNEGLWRNTPLAALLGLLLACILILALALGGCFFAGKALGFSIEDRITLLFCGSKKSLASGIPMAQVLFVGHTVVDCIKIINERIWYTDTGISRAFGNTSFHYIDIFQNQVSIREVGKN
jgi:sodium/bile acid cotransporter 7